jgi:hypothetical protein
MSQIKWMWLNDEGNSYNEFDLDISNLLEHIYSQCSGEKSKKFKNFVIPYMSFKWEFDFNNMTQTNQATKSKRKIIRVENGMVWICYKDNNRVVYSIIDPQDCPVFRPTDEWSKQLAKESGYNIPKRQYKYDKYDIKFTCDIEGLEEKTRKVPCDNKYTIEKIDISTLQSLVRKIDPLAHATAAPALGSDYYEIPRSQVDPNGYANYMKQYQQQHQQQQQQQPSVGTPLQQYQPTQAPMAQQYPVAAAATPAAPAAPVYSQHQSQLPDGWVMQQDVNGTRRTFYVNTKTGVSQWQPPGWIEYTDPAGRTYYGNPVTGITQYELPVRYGGKTGKKKNRIIKRKKTYKKGIYTKRKTIKR